MTFFGQKIQKNIVIIAVVFLVLILLAIFLTIRNQQKSAKIKNQTQLSQVSTELMLFPTLSLDGTKFYFYSNTRDLGFYEQKIDGSGLEKISGVLDEPGEVIWSPDKKYAILKVIYDQYKFEKFKSSYVSPGTLDQTVTTWVYDFTNKSLLRLNDVSNVVWQNNKIIFQQKNEAASSINIIDPDGKNIQKIVDIPTSQDLSLSLFASDKIVLCTEPSDVSGSTIYTLNLADKKLQEIKKTDFPSVTTGLTNGKILLETQNDKNIKVSVLNENGATTKKINIESDLSNFVDLGADLIILTKEYNQFFIINTNNGSQTLIKNLAKENLVAQNLFLSLDKKILYFTANNILQQLTIPDVK